jgi:putative ABC transport system permease protein
VSRASSYLSPLLCRAICRALWQTPGRLLAVIVLVAVAITVYAGTFTGLGHIADTAATLYRDLHLFDLELRITPQATDGVPSPDELRRRVPGLAAISTRLVLSASVEQPSRPHREPAHAGDAASVAEQSSSPPPIVDPARATGATIWAIDPRQRPAVGDVLLTAGEFLAPGQPDDVLLDKTFASEWGISVGDHLTVRVFEHVVPVRVRGIAVWPEHLMSSSLPDYPVPIRGVQAGLIVSQEKVAQLREHALVNSLAVTFVPGSASRREAIRSSLIEALQASGVHVNAGLWPEDQFSVHCTRVRILSYRDFLPTLILVFNGLSFLVLLLLVRRMAQAWRRELGTLISYGVHRSALILSWALSLFLLVAIGGLLGAAGAMRVAGQVSDQFLTGTGFPLLLPIRSLRPLWHAELLCLGIVWPAVLLPLLPLLFQPPSELFRDESQERESGPVLRLFAAVGRPLDRLLWLKTPEKLGFRNALRRPGVFLSATFSISAMLVVAASMFLFGSALPRGLDQFLSSQRWQMLIELAQPLTEGELAPILTQPGIAVWEGISVVPGSVRRAGSSAAPDPSGATAPTGSTGDARSYYLVAESRASKLRVPGGLGIVEGRYLSATDETAPEVVINLRLSQSLSLRVGDDLVVSTGSGPDLRLRIVGICTNYAINQVFLSRHSLSQLQPGPLRFAALVTAPQSPPLGGSDTTAGPGTADPLARDLDLEARLRALPQVARVVPWQPIKSLSLQGCDALVNFVQLYGNLGGAVALFLIFTVVLVGVSDRRSEYALLRSLGFSDLDLLRCVLAEVCLLTLCATLLCVPGTQLATWVFQQRLMQISDFVPIEFGLRACLTVLAPALLLMPLSALPAGRHAARLLPATLLRLRG